MATTSSIPVILTKKIWAAVPGSDTDGYSDPANTIQYAFGVVGADTWFGEISKADGTVDESKLIGGIHWVTGAQTCQFMLPPGKYRLYEFTIVRAPDGVSALFAKTGGWGFTALVNGTLTGAIGDESAVPFEVSATNSPVTLVGINKTLSVLVKKTADGKLKPGILFIGTSSYRGIFADPMEWNASAIVRMGVTDEQGSVRLDGFTSGCNVFIHEVIPKADYEAGVRPKQMDIYGLNGDLWKSCDMPLAHQVTQADHDFILRDPKINAASRALLTQYLHVGDYLCGASDYFYERQGMMTVKVTNSGSPNIRLCKKIWAGVPGSDAKGYSDPDATIRFAFGIIPAELSYSQITSADGYVDEKKLVGGIRRIDGAKCDAFSLPAGRYKLFEFRQVRAADGVSLKYERPGGWDFTVEIDGVRSSPSDDEEGIPFEVSTTGLSIALLGINKSLSAQITLLAAGKPKAGSLFFGTSSYLGLTPDKFNWNGGAIVRLGVTDSQGMIRLDGFSSGNNIFLHQVISQADYLAGARAEKMEVKFKDGRPWFIAGFPDIHQVTSVELETLLRDPKLNSAARELIQKYLKAGDYLFTNQNYFYDRQGVMPVIVTNNR